MNGSPWLVFIFSLVLSFAWTVFLYRMRGGFFNLRGSTSTTSVFKTTLGDFRLDSKHDRLQMKTRSQGWAGIRFDEIRALTYERTENASWLNELITGFNIWDFSGKYRDQVITCSIDVVRTDGTSIPIYTASQLEEREFWLWGWWVQCVRAILEAMNLSTNVEEHSRSVYSQLRNEFERHGVRIDDDSVSQQNHSQAKESFVSAKLDEPVEYDTSIGG